MKITEIIKRALEQPTLEDALTFAAIIETERAVEQAKLFLATGNRTPDGQGWETCFKVLFKEVLDGWYHKTGIVSATGQLDLTAEPKHDPGKKEVASALSLNQHIKECWLLYETAFTDKQALMPKVFKQMLLMAEAMQRELNKHSIKTTTLPDSQPK